MARKKSIKHKKRLLLEICIIIVVIMICLALLATEYFRPGSIPFLDGIFTKSDPIDNPDNNDIVDTVPSFIDINNSLKVYFFDVGQGDSILLRFPCNTDILIDAGSGTSASNDRVTAYLAMLEGAGLDDIEYMIATHPDSDHINMLDDVLETYEVQNIYYNGYMHTSATFTKFCEGVADETYGENVQASVELFDGDGDIYTLSGDNYSVAIYAPGYERFNGANSMSPIIVAEYGNRKIVLTGDAEFNTEQWWLQNIGVESMDCDILKVGHHGSSSSTSQEFLDFVTCEYAVISAGANNSYGHPHADTLYKLNEEGYTIYRTDLGGTITCYIDLDGDIAFMKQK